MKTSQNGIDLICGFEGFSAKPYKVQGANEKQFTWGFGHYGSDVPSPESGKTITKEQAQELLKKDLAKFEGFVNAVGLKLNSNQFDALVSFTYNVGNGNLLSLVKGRTLPQIADALLLYNKAGGHEMAGLIKRRKLERELFLKPVPQPKLIQKAVYHKVANGDTVGELAKKYGSTIVQIKAWNHLDSHYTVYVGKTIRVK